MATVTGISAPGVYVTAFHHVCIALTVLCEDPKENWPMPLHACYTASIFVFEQYYVVVTPLIVLAVLCNNMLLQTSLHI